MIRYDPAQTRVALIKLDACKEWLANQLSIQPARVKDVRARAALAGYGPHTYTAVTRQNVPEYVIDGRKWWRLPDPFPVPLV